MAFALCCVRVLKNETDGISLIITMCKAQDLMHAIQREVFNSRAAVERGDTTDESFKQGFLWLSRGSRGRPGL